MYDKVKIWLDRAMVGEQFPTIANYLNNAKMQVNLQTGEEKTFGSLDGLKVSILESGISIEGSLPKYLYGNNVYKFDRRATAQAIEKLSDTLHIEANKAKVNSIEFGTNFLMKHQVSEYLLKLGEMPRLERYLFEPTSLYYKSKQSQKVFAFYDKNKEIQANNIELSEISKNDNLLRYEMRLKNRLPAQLKVPEVTASTLSDKQFYKMMVKLYKERYFSIQKAKQIKANYMSEIKTVQDAYDAFVANLISQNDQRQEYLRELKRANVFTDRKNYTRLKDKLEKICSKANITASDELMSELDNEIKNCCTYT